jgi:aminoglycoside phosphotransferase
VIAGIDVPNHYRDEKVVHPHPAQPNGFLIERAGVGDRHQDVALAIRSLTHNFGSATVAPFLASIEKAEGGGGEGHIVLRYTIGNTVT